MANRIAWTAAVAELITDINIKINKANSELRRVNENAAKTLAFSSQNGPSDKRANTALDEWENQRRILVDQIDLYGELLVEITNLLGAK